MPITDSVINTISRLLTRNCFLLLVAASLVFVTDVSSQTIILSSENFDLYTFDLDNCTTTLTTTLSIQTSDVSFGPDGDLFGIAGSGNLFRIDTATGAVQLLHIFMAAQTWNSLTVDTDGVFYATGSKGFLWTYDPISGVATDLGDLSIIPAGDLLFEDNTLYVSSVASVVFTVELTDPLTVSPVLFGDTQGELYGMISYADSCDATVAYVISEEGFVYEADFSTGTYVLTCALGISVNGGAATYDFLSVPPLQITALDLINPSCGMDNGSVEVFADGGGSVLLYSVNNDVPDTPTVFTQLPADNYSLTVLDSLGCRLDTSFTLNNIAAASIDSITSSPITCRDSSGTLTVFAAGGTGQLRYALDSSNFQDSPVFNLTDAGTYTVLVKDENECLTQTFGTLAAIAGPEINSLTVEDPTCGSSNGELLVSGATGSPPLAFALDGAAFGTTNVYADLEAGTYQIAIRDSLLCTDTAFVTLTTTQPPMIDSLLILDTRCGLANGTLLVRATGDTPLTFMIVEGNAQLDSLFAGLAGGSYQLFATDANGCRSDTAFTVADSRPLLAELQIDPSTCELSNGSIQFIVTEGEAPIQLTFDGDSPADVLLQTDLSGGEYALSLTDAAGCRIDTLAFVRTLGCTLEVPNVFLPDGAEADRFFAVVPHPEFGGRLSSLRIYNRWGALVFETEGTDVSTYRWDGSDRGVPQAMDTYVYVVEYLTAEGLFQRLTGDVTLTR